MITCECGKLCKNERSYKIHLTKCNKYDIRVRKVLTKEFFDHYCGDENMAVYTVIGDVLNNVYPNSVVVKIAKEYGYVPLSKSEANKASESKRRKTNLDRYGCEGGPGTNTYYIIRNDERVNVPREYISDKLCKEFFDKYIGELGMQIPDILHNILDDEFSYPTILSHARIHGYNSDNRSVAAQKAHDLGKNKKTTLINHGVDNVSQSPKIKQKKKETMVEHFGVTHHLKLDSQKEIQSNTVMDRYGVDNISKYDEIKEKKISTFIEHYGFKNIFSDPILMKQFYMDKFGVDNPMKLSHIFNKAQDTLQENHGTRCFGHLAKSSGKLSKISQILFNSIRDRLTDYHKDLCDYGTMEDGEFCVIVNESRRIFLDFTISDADNKLCIEFDGDMWHANPNKYKYMDHPNPFYKDMTAQDIWDKDLEKHGLIKSAGFHLLNIWESEYTSNPEQTLNKCLSFINNHIPGASHLNEVV